jgi:hypothetical protein
MPDTSSTGALPGEPEEVTYDRSPVFVLTASRSGSTLLRFILDSHPDLACPPETGIASTCAKLVQNWGILEHADSPTRVNAPLSPEGARAVRATVDEMFGRYLLRRGKRRWCDKSLDTHLFAELMVSVYPDARFICLFRHCMDVIASGVEAAPWGLNGFGFNAHAVKNPTNSVAAIGSYWAECADGIIAFMDKHPQVCHQVRYEDLVTDPEGTAAAIFAFLGMDQVPGIADLAFRTAHEGGGPGDEKIWFTGAISSGSMGRGVMVPASALPAPLTASINEKLARLQYRQIDDRWNRDHIQVDPRVLPAPGDAGTPAADGDEKLAAARQNLADRLDSCPDQAWRAVSAHWPALAGTVTRLIIQSAGRTGAELEIRFRPREEPDPADPDPDTPRDAEAGQDQAATITADAGTWLDLLNGRTNLISEIRAGRIRRHEPRETARIRTETVHATATLLGLATIPLLAEHQAAALPTPPG